MPSLEILHLSLPQVFRILVKVNNDLEVGREELSEGFMIKEEILNDGLK